MNPFGSNHSICIGFRICRQVIYGKNERSMQEPYCHSCMLPNGTVGIILWLVMSYDFLQSITTSHVDAIERWCGDKTETWYSEQKGYVYDYEESQRLLCCRQTLKSYQNEQRLFCTKYTYSALTSDLSSRKGASWKTTSGSSWQLLSSHKSDFNRLAWRTQCSPHVIPTVFTWSGL
jgi:hypothetical protein